MGDSFRQKTILAGIGVLCLAAHLWSVHRWFADPFPIWAGWDEAYITAFAQRMLDGRGLPYVDAVSHRGPVLYWMAAAIQSLAGQGWLGMRHAALLLAETNVLLAFLLGIAVRRPLAGFVASATFVFFTLYAMEPKDGVGFNGEIAAMPFVLLGSLLTVVGQGQRPNSESRVWFAAGSGLLIMIGGLCKQPAAFHLLPFALWWFASAIQEKSTLGRIDYRPSLAFLIGATTPLLAVFAFFAQAGAWRPFSYYLFTYNRDVYMGPVSIGYAIESSFLFWRSHGALLLLTMIVVAWAASRFASKLDGLSLSAWSKAFSHTAWTTTLALQLLLALAGAFGTFRFWDHYFITALPWFGLLAGTLLEERIAPRNASGVRRITRACGVVILFFVAMSFVQRHLTTLWLDGQRQLGQFYGNPEEEPIGRYVRKHTPPDESVFVWGFAPEIYTTAQRRAATRYVYTTFPSGLVPWFHWLTFEQEESLVVPGSRDVLLRELEMEKPPLILDVPNSMHGRSMRRYAQLASYLEANYCYLTTLFGHNGRVADVYHRRDGVESCTLVPPPLPKAK